jgi:hypothetical protein
MTETHMGQKCFTGSVQPHNLYSTLIFKMMVVMDNTSKFDIDEINLPKEYTGAESCNWNSEGHIDGGDYRYGELSDYDSFSYQQSMPAVYSQRMNSQDNHKVMPPRRPMTSYNIFFLLERERIVTGGQERSYTAEDAERIVALQKWKDAHYKRKHRKSHGIISFKDLSVVAAASWRKLDHASKKIFHDCAAKEKPNYAKAMLAWRKSERHHNKSNLSQLTGNNETDRNDQKPEAIQPMMLREDSILQLTDTSGSFMVPPTQIIIPDGSLVNPPLDVGLTNLNRYASLDSVGSWTVKDDRIWHNTSSNTLLNSQSDIDKLDNDISMDDCTVGTFNLQKEEDYVQYVPDQLTHPPSVSYRADTACIHQDHHHQNRRYSGTASDVPINLRHTIDLPHRNTYANDNNAWSQTYQDDKNQDEYFLSMIRDPLIVDSQPRTNIQRNLEMTAAAYQQTLGRHDDQGISGKPTVSATASFPLMRPSAYEEDTTTLQQYMHRLRRMSITQRERRMSGEPLQTNDIRRQLIEIDNSIHPNRSAVTPSNLYATVTSSTVVNVQDTEGQGPNRPAHLPQTQNPLLDEQIAVGGNDCYNGLHE